MAESALVGTNRLHTGVKGLSVAGWSHRTGRADQEPAAAPRVEEGCTSGCAPPHDVSLHSAHHRTHRLPESCFKFGSLKK